MFCVCFIMCLLCLAHVFHRSWCYMSSSFYLALQSSVFSACMQSALSLSSGAHITWLFSTHPPYIARTDGLHQDSFLHLGSLLAKCTHVTLALALLFCWDLHWDLSLGSSLGSFAGIFRLNLSLGSLNGICHCDLSLDSFTGILV